MSADFDGAKAAVFLGDKLLVYRRDIDADLPYPGLWDFPGGGREGDESPEETVLRELEEEFGLTPGPEAIRWRRVFPALDQPDKRLWFFVLSLPEEAAREVKFGVEGTEWRLMSWEEFDDRPDTVPVFGVRMARWRDETGGTF